MEKCRAFLTFSYTYKVFRRGISSMKRSEVDKEKLSPMMVQYLEIKEKYEDTIIFFRLGDFYEMFFEDAVTCSHELELTLTGKNAGLDERVPLCGIPYHAYQPYVDKLIDKGYKVAICEQLSDPKLTKGMVERDVIQVVTKGTRLDASLDAKSNNYIGSVYDFEYCYGFSFADISTGSFYCMMLPFDEDKVVTEIINRSIQEVIVNDRIDRKLVNLLRENYGIIVTIQNTLYEENEYEFLFENLKDVRELTATKHLLQYLVATKKGDLSHLQKIERLEETQFLLFDMHTKKNLELTETLRTRDRIYSLLWLLDKNKTAMGSRYLKYNIENPLVDQKEIERRYNIVTELQTQFILREELRTELDNVYDLERLAGRISYGSLNARDLLQLKTSLRSLPAIHDLLREIHYDKTIDTMDEVFTLLDSSINEDAPISLKEGSLIKDGYNVELDELKAIRRGSKDFVLTIEQSEKEKTGIKNLKVGFNKVFGYYIEVSKGSIPLIKDEFGYERKQTLANCERFITPELKEKENIILSSEEKIINLEYQLFMNIREVVKRYIPTIQAISKVIAEVDMLISFAVVSEENNYVCPTLTEDRVIKITDSRHPVLEKVVKGSYVNNDIDMDKDTDILLITGPNMAGKSTYMRQLAITVIMAQIGCFVPAKKAIMPIFDKIFTRIGASDDLVGGESTFMVEMKEANHAISEATERSLILFDELGRGTATYDGIALAQAILEYIHDKIKAKTLFSTHYHELTSLSKDLKKLRNVHASATEEDGKVTFLHKIKNGAVDKSYGIHVASLAQLPDDLITRAESILNTYEKKEYKKPAFTQTTLELELDKKVPCKEEVITTKLKEVDPLTMTPMEAINFVYDLKQTLTSRKS